MTPPSTHFDLQSHWRIPAPVDHVWSAIADPASWPRWWPYVRRVQTLRDGDADGVGAIRRIHWATRLPYAIVIDVEAVESVRHQRLRGRARGQLEGEGTWLLHARGDVTDVTYLWRVQVTKPWMRRMAPLLAPVFRWNHDGVMRAGEAGLRRHLDAGERTDEGRCLAEWATCSGADLPPSCAPSSSSSPSSPPRPTPNPRSTTPPSPPR